MIIIKGRSRGDGGQLANYLTKKGDNGRVDVLGSRGFGRPDLRSAFRLAETEAELSKGSKPFWHAQINPADGIRLTREQQAMAVEILERRLGLTGQPRAVVLHEKDGREHLHVVWSRYDRETGTLRRDSFTKIKNVLASAEIALRLGLTPNRNPFAEGDLERLTREKRREHSKAADTHAEQQQDARAAAPRQDRKAEICAIWRATDSGRALRAALGSAGYTLAQGTRGFVVIDANGEAHSLARQIDGARAKDIRSRLADLDLASVPQAEQVQRSMRQAPFNAARATQAAGPDDVPPPSSLQDILVGPLRAAAAAQLGGKNKAPETSSGAQDLPPRTAGEVLAALTRHHSTFTRQELARLVDRSTGGGGEEPWMTRSGGIEKLEGDARASAERSYERWAGEHPELAARIGLARYVSYVQGRQAERDAADPDIRETRLRSRHAFDTLMAEVEGSPELIRLGPDRVGRERFTSRDMLGTELQMQGAGGRLAAASSHAVPEKLRDAVPGLDMLGKEQRAALDHVTAPAGLSLVVGFAGTGKSRTLGLAREAWEASGYRVRGAALSGIAAESLQNDAGIESRTLHSLLHQLETVEGREAALRAVGTQIEALSAIRNGNRGHRKELAYARAKHRNMAHDLEACRLTARDVIVIDEAAMVGSRQMERLLSAASQAGAKVVLVGDHEQLQAIDAGAAFRALRNAHGAVEITEVRRQAGDQRQWMRDATAEFGRARTSEALARYHHADMVHGAGTRDEAKANLVITWTAARQETPERSQIILAYTRADVAELNQLAREAYLKEGRLGADVTLKTAQGDKAFAAGDRLYFTRNDTRLTVRNGSLGTVEAIEGGRVAVRLDNGRTVKFDVADYGHIAHGYAATVHKSQGVTVDRAYVLASRYMDRHATYVGMTRHREQADLYYGTEEFRSFDSLSRCLSRDGTKDTTLDYLSRSDGYAVTGDLRAAADDIRRGSLPSLSMPRESAAIPPPPGPALEMVRPSERAGMNRPEEAQGQPAEPAPSDQERRAALAKRLLRQLARNIRKPRGHENSRE